MSSGTGPASALLGITRPHRTGQSDSAAAADLAYGLAFVEKEQGVRLVSGGQTGPYDDTGRCPWQVTDWRTGEVIATGTSSLDEFNAAWCQLDPNNQWFQVDRVGDQVPVTSPSTPGLPPTLVSALADWVGAMGTPDR